MELVNPGSLLIQLFNLSVVVYVLYRFIFKPYLAFIDEETEKREALEVSIHAAEHIISDARKEAKSIVDTAKNESRTIMTNAEVLAKKEASLMIAHATEEITDMKAKAELDIANERKQMEGAMQDRILTIALKLNEKLFGKEGSNADFIKQAMKE